VALTTEPDLLHDRIEVLLWEVEQDYPRL